MTVLQPAAVEPSPYGLVNSKTLVSDNVRWESGFDQETVACNTAVRIIDICSTATTASAIDPSGVSFLPTYSPFAIQATVECSTMGSANLDWNARALAGLAACQDKAIELEFWEGRLARKMASDNPSIDYTNRYLSDGGAVDVTPTPGTPVRSRYGLALLEGALADAGCGIRGFIHAPRSVASVLPLKDKDDDGVLTTTLGNYVIAGSGYTGTGTNGAPTSGTSVWMYATGPVSVRIGEGVVNAEERSQSINTKTNSISVTAETEAAVTWDGCAHFKVLVDLAADYA